MLRRCAWCGLNLGYKEPLDDRAVTHGVCTPCAERMLEGRRQMEAAGDPLSLIGASVAQVTPLSVPRLCHAPG